MVPIENGAESPRGRYRKHLQAMSHDRLKNYVAAYLFEKVKLAQAEVSMQVAGLKLVIDAGKHPNFAEAAKELANAKSEIEKMKKITSGIDTACSETESEIQVEDGKIVVVPSTSED